jgi:hypothetical protein
MFDVLVKSSAISSLIRVHNPLVLFGGIRWGDVLRDNYQLIIWVKYYLTQKLTVICDVA